MRRILFATFLLLGLVSFGQVKVSVPQITYVGEWQYADLTDLSVGRKILFQQDCIPALPKDVPNGIVMFRNVVHEDQRFAVAIEFKDTVVESVTCYLTAGQKDLLPVLGFSNIEGIAASKKSEWTYMKESDARLDVIVGGRKKITVISRRED